MRDLQTRNAACFDRSFARTAEAVMEPSAASSRGQLRVFVTSCELGEDAWRGQEERLKHLYELSDKRYALTNDPGSADIILIGDVRGEAWGKKILEHPLINKDVDRCFSLSHASQPVILHHGVYTGAAKSILNLGRVRTGSYTAYPDEYMNPHITGYQYSEHNRIKKDYLLVFIGRTWNDPRLKARNAILKLKFERRDVLIEDSSSFDLWSPMDPNVKVNRQQRYFELLLRAKFSLCPRGGGPNSIRLFESMQLGVAPVIVSDKFILPKGPKWSEFSILLKERDIRHVERVVQAHEPAYHEMGRLARKAFDDYFAEDKYFNYVVDNCVDMMGRQTLPEALCWRLNPMVVRVLKTKETLRGGASAVRSGVKLLLHLRLRLNRRQPQVTSRIAPASAGRQQDRLAGR